MTQTNISPFTTDAQVTQKIQEAFKRIDTTIDFSDWLSLNSPIRADIDNMAITSIENVWNTPTVTLTVDGNPYVFGTPIPLGTSIMVEVDTFSVIKLKIIRPW